MTLVLVIAGLILLLAGSGWFAAATTVGTILLVAGGVLFVVELIWYLFVASQAKKISRRQQSIFDRF
jgi:uncharacterized protein YjeT (DUF2065 family)